jgi:hypothetical protein
LVDYRLTGGFAGIDHHMVLSADGSGQVWENDGLHTKTTVFTLGHRSFERLRGLLDAAPWPDPAVSSYDHPPGVGVADAFAFEVRYQDATVTGTDIYAPQWLREVLRQLDETAQRHLPSLAPITGPAPTGCESGFVRASPISPGQIEKTTAGHFPTWLPSGFGLQQAYGEGDGQRATVLWTDEKCRLVELLVGPSPRDYPGGPHVGRWTLFDRSDASCGGEGPSLRKCALVYGVNGKNFGVTLQIYGLKKSEAERVVRSVPL